MQDGNVKREKYWEELTDSEKIERMRAIMKQKVYLENQLNELQNQVRQLRQVIVFHSHLDGKVVEPVSEYPKNGGLVPMVGGNVQSSSKPMSDKEVYF